MLLEASERRALAGNIRDLVDAGWQCVVLHGGGPQLNALQHLHGLVPNKVEGRRVTSPEDLLVVKQALCGEVNVDLVSALLSVGVAAFGCHGASGVLIEAEKRPPIQLTTQGVVDFGEVGDVVNINTELLEVLLSAQQVPVIASLGASRKGRIFNINADTTVAAIARSLSADLLILSTKIGGIFHNVNDPQSRIPEITQAYADQLIEQGVISDGMIPKVQEALGLLSQGVGSIIITNAARQNAFLDLALGNNTHGTRLNR